MDELWLTVPVQFLFVMGLGWYMITNLQWYSYRFDRVILKHHKQRWHFAYFILPLLAYFVAGEYFVYILPAYLIALIAWHQLLDKKLVLTWRVRRFLILLAGLTLFIDYLCYIKQACVVLPVFLPLSVAWIVALGIEKYLFAAYRHAAYKKLRTMPDLTIVAVTGSYGKTSTKNFIAQILSHRYRVYATPRSVNTLGGIIRDVNESLPQNTEVYVCEAGARRSGDILEIAQFLHPHYVVVGKIGPQHIEYFQSIENIRRTKLELIHSKRLMQAFVHCEVTDEPHDKVRFFGSEIESIDANLERTAFDLRLDAEPLHLEAPVLGGFNAVNIEAAILVARAVGMTPIHVVEAVEELKPVEHRLQRIDAGGKIILDDSYNGNLDGMLEGIRLCLLHPGRRVIVTPGLVESSEELNHELIQAINDVFDLVIVTGSLNAPLFKKYLDVKEAIYLEEKSTMTQLLQEKTAAGEIIHFANDAPNFI